jgi:hypothetical protein
LRGFRLLMNEQQQESNGEQDQCNDYGNKIIGFKLGFHQGFFISDSLARLRLMLVYCIVLDRIQVVVGNSYVKLE